MIQIVDVEVCNDMTLSCVYVYHYLNYNIKFAVHE